MSDELELYGTAAGEVAAALAGTSPGKEGLEWFADIIRGRRARTQVKVLSKTAEALREAGLSPRVVPARTLVPLLEFAGLEDEDDEEMVSRWANLLANASADEDQPPSFPHILRQLSGRQARALERLRIVGEEETIRTHRETEVTVGEIYDLARLRLVDLKPEEGVPAHALHIGRWQLGWLGQPFVDACRSPAVRRASD